MIPVVYNTEAENKQLHGRVDLAVLFNEKGLVDKVDVLSGDPVLGANASNFVKLWEIAPHVVDGVARPVKLDYSLQFVYNSVADEVPETDRDAPAHLVLSEKANMARRWIKKGAPSYPESARVLRIQGKVKLAVIIGTDGRVALLTTLSGQESLVSSALDAVRKWQYEPLLVHGVPVTYNTLIIVSYTLN
jgi:TonB family protein